MSGLNLKLNFVCVTLTCEWNESFNTSKSVRGDGRGATSFDINNRAVITMREIGKGHTALWILEFTSANER